MWVLGTRSIAYAYTARASPHETSLQPAMMTSNAAVTERKGAFMYKVILHIKLSLVFLSSALSGFGGSCMNER